MLTSSISCVPHVNFNYSKEVFDAFWNTFLSFDSALSVVVWASCSTSCVIAVDPFTRVAWIGWNLTPKDRDSGRIMSQTSWFTCTLESPTQFSGLLYFLTSSLFLSSGIASLNKLFTMSAKSLSTAF